MSKTNLIYNVNDKPSWGKTLIFALQQLLAILAATIAVPTIINSSVPALAGNGMSQSAALFGAGVGTLVYLLFTKFKSPAFLGSSFAFINSMIAAFAGAVSASVGLLGIIIGAIAAGLVYVIISIVVKFVGTNWINKIMPAVVIGPIVAIIGLSLAGNAIGDLFKGGVYNTISTTGFFESAQNLAEGYKTLNVGENVIYFGTQNNSVLLTDKWIALICGLVTLFVTIITSVYGKKMMKMIPFVIGILSGYALASIFTLIGHLSDVGWLQVIDFSKFNNIEWYPSFTFIRAIQGFQDFETPASFFSYLGTILVAYVPVAFVVFAEHIADHKNLSSIIGQDLIQEPGLHRTLLGDGVGSMAGALFGGCPNTTYGESVGTIAISGNASIRTIVVTSLLCIVLSFIGPFSTFLATIPPCVMGGVCIALYGFIAVSGLKMIQPINLSDNRNLFVVSVILIAGIGGFTLVIGEIIITAIACSLILGVIVNVIVNLKKAKKEEQPE